MAFGIDDAIAAALRIVDKVIPDPTAKAAAALEAAKLKQAGDFKDIDALLQSDANQVQVNVEEAKSDSLFKSGWRPYIGWTCGGGLSYQLVFRPIASWVAGNLWGWQPAPSLEMETLLTLLFGMLGLGAYRTYERVKLTK